jgi:hypothetical protein
MYSYHAGLAQLKAGDVEKGRASLRQAITLGLSGADAVAAKRELED